MKRTKIAAAVLAGVVLILLLAGCGSFGEAHDYNAPAPSKNITPDWTRIDSPYHYHTIIRACVARDEVYENLADGNSVEVVPNDPACAAK